MERNFEMFSLPRNGSERSSESLLLFLFHGMEFRDGFPRVFCSSEQLEFRNKNHLFCLLRLPRNYLLSELPNPTCADILPGTAFRKPLLIYCRSFLVLFSLLMCLLTESALLYVWRTSPFSS
jgi:hypothetical protein